VAAFLPGLAGSFPDGRTDCGDETRPEAAPFACSQFVVQRHGSRFPRSASRNRRVRKRAASPGKNAANRQHRPAITLPLLTRFSFNSALQLVGASVTLGTQSVSRAPIAQYHRKRKSVPVQDRPISTSFPSLAGPVNHPEGGRAPQIPYAHFPLASRQIDLVLIFPGAALELVFFRPVHSGEREVHLVLFVLLSPRKRHELPFCPPRAKFEPPFRRG